MLVGAAFVAASLAVAWVASRHRQTRPIAFGLLWFFVALLPTSSIVPLAEPMNDHRMFFPFVGLILAVVWSAWLVVRRARHALADGGRGLGDRHRRCDGVRHLAAQRVWRTEESLWLDATIKSPDNGRGLMNYGVIQMSKGNYRVADEYFERALAVHSAATPIFTSISAF